MTDSALLTNIKDEDSDFFDAINDVIIKGVISGIAFNLLYQWLLPIINAISK